MHAPDLCASCDDVHDPLELWNILADSKIYPIHLYVFQDFSMAATTGVCAPIYVLVQPKYFRNAQ